MKEFNIEGQVIKRLYRSSKGDNWALLQTDRATFELRLGGLQVTTEKRSQEFAIDLPVMGKVIKAVKTDDFALYFELESGECLTHSDTWIDGNGNTGFEIKLVSKSDFEKERVEWYDLTADLKEIK